jgi:hypothetical protein
VSAAPTATYSNAQQRKARLHPLPYQIHTHIIHTHTDTSYAAPLARRHTHANTPCPLQRSHQRSLVSRRPAANSLPLTQPPTTATALIAPRAPPRAPPRPVLPVALCRRRRTHRRLKHTRGPPQITSRTSQDTTSSSPTSPDPSAARGEASRETIQWLISPLHQMSPHEEPQVTLEVIHDTIQSSRSLLLLQQTGPQPQNPGRQIPRT